MTDLILGVDTSCYTTSLALVDNKGNIVLEAKKPLIVKKGRRGLRQSDAFFQHIFNLSELISNFDTDSIKRISQIWVSTKPRNLENSYMPVFMAGFNFAKVMSKSLNVPLYETSHQEGHIMAVCMGTDMDYKSSYLAIHLSGGTTEILLCKYDVLEDVNSINIVAKTLDISAGQLLDRVGVMAGFEFPSGQMLDKSAENLLENNISADYKLDFPISLKGNDFNFSGAESWAMRYLKQDKPIEYIADGLFTVIAKTLYSSLCNISDKTGIYDVIMSGGVSSSVNLKRKLLDLSSNSNLHFHFAATGYCVDNARGVAGMGLL